MKSGSLINHYTLLLSIFLLSEGIWGLFSYTVFAFMTTNLTHAVIHIALGITGIFLAINHKTYGYCLIVGSLLAVVGAMYMIPATRAIIVKLLNVNEAVAVFNVVAGGFALLVAYAGERYVQVKHHH